MLKLKDIFNIDISSKGGVKLFNKIANKYNLRKEDRKDLMNVEVGGGSEKTYYYKIDTYGFRNEVGRDTVEQRLEVLNIIYYNTIGYITNERGDDVRGRYYLSGAPNVDNMLTFNGVEGVIVTDAAPFGMMNPLLVYGSIFERVDAYTRIMSKAYGDNEDMKVIMSFIHTFLKYFTEITKEEFFAMNDEPFVDIDDYLNEIN